MGLGSAVVLVPDPATALPFLLSADLALPHHAQGLGASHLPALCGFRSRPQLGVIVRVISHVVPAA
jgi:hypothetical protein